MLEEKSFLYLKKVQNTWLDMSQTPRNALPISTNEFLTASKHIYTNNNNNFKYVFYTCASK